MKGFVIRLLTYFLVLTLPYWNGFRMDIDANRFYLFGYELGYSASYLFFLFLLMLIAGFIGLAMVWKRFFCKFVCPHNTISYALNQIEFKLGTPGKAFTILLSIAASLFMAVSTVGFFYDPTVIVESLVNIEPNKYFWLVLSLWFIYIGMTYKARNSFCKVCPYGLAQGVSGIDRKVKPIRSPGVWLTWGTTIVLFGFLLAGWMK